MHETYVMVMMGVLVVFSIIGISCGLIVYSECNLDVREKETVKNCHILMIVSLIFVVMFTAIYFTWNLLHSHHDLKINKSTRMR